MSEKDYTKQVEKRQKIKKDRKNMRVSKKVCSNPAYLYNYIHVRQAKLAFACWDQIKQINL